MQPLDYQPHQDTADTPNVVVDGSPNAATVLTISHWPGLEPPPDCQADTSAQMAFRYLDRGADLHGAATIVTNNHFDQDGLAGLYALVDPDNALMNRALLEDLARAGDFAVFTDRTAARLSTAIHTLTDGQRSPIALPEDPAQACAELYTFALSRLPSWLDNPELCRDLWLEEDAQLDQAMTDLAAGRVLIDERPAVDLTVVLPTPGAATSGHRFAERSFAGIHPMALHSVTDMTQVLVLDAQDGRHRLTSRYEGWVQYRSRPIRPRRDLRPLADRLTDDEPDGAMWHALPPSDLAPELDTIESGPASSIDPHSLTELIVEYLGHAPVAFNPFP